MLSSYSSSSSPSRVVFLFLLVIATTFVREILCGKDYYKLLGVDRQAAGGVDDHDVTTEPLRLLDPLERREHRVLRVGVDGHVDLRGQRA